MGITLAGFFECTCGKIHSYGGLTRTSKCSCGADLWRTQVLQPLGFTGEVAQQVTRIREAHARKR